ncbi:DNA polymerase [uncultured Phascolarctobacterium sp.]|uniref:DNA polymerase n=1 Tax=uncultured Phascolarctobacterium sp. TaxID=512296 RepID=UPI0027D976C4|nr:DNA polymerase [uncultured Phascolarctobacterium sp.]
MDTLSIDIETYSSANLNKTGVYRYAGEADFEILLLSYSLNGGPVQVVDLARGESIPLEIEEAIKSPKVLKWAFNANFERICLSKYFMEWLEPEGWHCTMLWAATLGLPLSLEGVGSVLGLEKQKLIEGKSLIKYFCVPCAPSKVNGGRLRNLPSHALDKWGLFKAYNKRDVETELAIQKKLSKFPVPEELWEEYYLDQQINDRGIGIDKELVKEAIALDTRVKAELKTKMQELTHLDNPNSVQQLLGWLSEKGLAADSLGKKAVAELLKTAPAELREVLELRLQLAKSSVKKYTAMESALCADSRARGMFQFYGANRTGRFSGRLIQLQNLPQNHMVDLAEARSLVRAGDYELLKLFYGDIPDTLSQLIRTAFVPQENRKFIVADFSAIEARVLAWLAGETWRLKTFEEGGDIYCASASKMFKVPVVKHGINGELRQKGKIAELALGYGGSVGALTAMGALEMGLEEKELKPLVSSWRSANPKIVSLWWEVDKAIKECVITRTARGCYGLKFRYQSGFLFVTLPSGRKLAYVKPRIGENKFGGEAVTYEGIGMTKKWERLESYGPKFVENIIQAIARDLLVYAMLTLKHCAIVAHVHDEVIIEADRRMSLAAVCAQMSRTPSWAEGLVLRADGYECDFYKKD